jgi:transposase-like protein
MGKERPGEIRAFPLENTDKDTLQAGIAANVKPGSKVYTDSHKGYGSLNAFEHQAVVQHRGRGLRSG